MKRVLPMTLVWLLMVTVLAQADGQQRTEQVRESLDAIKERLSLTPEQVELVRPVLEEQVRKAKALREKYGDGQRGDRLKMSRELRDIQRATDDRLRTMLSKAQMEELAKIRDERRKQLRNRPGDARR